MRARPLDAFPLIRTNSVEELRAALQRMFAGLDLQLPDDGRPLQAVKNHCQLMHVGVGYSSYRIGMDVQLQSSSHFVQSYLLGGKAKVATQGEEVCLDANNSVVVSANAGAFGMTMDDDYERLAFMIDPIALESKLAAMIGQHLTAPLIIQPAQDLSDPMARELHSHFIFLLWQLDAGRASSLVLAELEQTLMMMFLGANRHSYSDLLFGNVHDAALRDVRLVEEFIEANWMRPVTLEDLAAISGVSGQCLFRAFRKVRGCSPLDFLMQVRLRHARAHLQNPDAATTVAAVASLCGFGDLEKFAAAYARAFGERPQYTLSRGVGPCSFLH